MPPNDKDFLLTKSKVFCIRPWVHLHINTQGEVLPCCIAPKVLGNTNRKSIDEIRNGPLMHSFRKEILSEIKNDACTSCYQKESGGLKSMRQLSNEAFAHKFSSVEATINNSQPVEIKPVFWDIRFSNVCNFRCRTCSHHSSSKWFEEAKLLGEQVTNRAIISSGDNATILKQLEQYIDEVEEIYFAGGEPLLMEEQYEILRLLIVQERTNVRLWYNTNFSTLNYKNYDILNLWNKFSNVTISASLDASYKRGEYLRKEQNWDHILQNLQTLSQKAPHVIFRIQSTVSAFNAYHLTDFHREWIDQKYILPENIELNILHHPEYYNMQLLPVTFKIKIKEKTEAHIEYLRELAETNKVRYDEQIHSYEGLIRYLFMQNRQDMFTLFLKKVELLDSIREEAFLERFPEFSDSSEL